MANSKEQACRNESLVEVFVDICIKEVHRNSKPQSHFTSNGWNTIITSFVEQTGKDYTKKQLKNKWDALKGEWILWKDLKNKYTGLGWDPKLNTVVATEERWSQIIGKTKEFARFKKKGISPEFETKLDILFSDITATGKHAWAPSSSIPIPNSSEECDNVNYVEGSGDSDERDASNYTRYAHRDRHFVRGEESENGEGAMEEEEDDVEEQNHHGAQEMETLRNNIAQSLMVARLE
ncbi:L10-interacting MYB domain-containing protein-like [Argentina anserina]|uniref:L10-interacting MYB domain-containing protein-like n=1 Tax=Argentina anserina TaxID=57926 RepID=UPI0021769337|nr:L10-interacting MYB domain-containing protein-like [Potentilla anserina]